MLVTSAGVNRVAKWCRAGKSYVALCSTGSDFMYQIVLKII
jgi:hypothetical protein